MSKNPKEYLSSPDNMPPPGDECVVDAKGEKLLKDPGSSRKNCEDASNVEDSIPVREKGKME